MSFESSRSEKNTRRRKSPMATEMADRQSRTSRSVQKVSHMDQSCTSQRQVMENNRTGSTSQEKDGKRENRRAKPEIPLYRPGMGLLQKNHGGGKADTPVALLAEVKGHEPTSALKDGINGKWAAINRAKRPDKPVYTPRQVKSASERPFEGRSDAVVDSRGPPSSAKPFPSESARPSPPPSSEVAAVNRVKKTQHTHPPDQRGERRMNERNCTEDGPREFGKISRVNGPSSKPGMAVMERCGPGGDGGGPSKFAVGSRERRPDRPSLRMVSRRGRGGGGNGRHVPFPDTHVEENWELDDEQHVIVEKPVQEAPPVRKDGRPRRTSSPHLRNGVSDAARQSASDDADDGEQDVRRRAMKKKTKKKKNKPKEDRQQATEPAVNGFPAKSPTGSNPLNCSVTTEEDWDGELMEVSGKSCGQEDVSKSNGNVTPRERNDSYQSSSPEPCRSFSRRFGNRHRRGSFSEEEKDAGGRALSRNGPLPAPLIKDWSVAVAEEEEQEQRNSLERRLKADGPRNNSCGDSEVRRKNRRNDVAAAERMGTSLPPKQHDSHQLPPRFQKRNQLPNPENAAPLSVSSPAVKGGLIRLPRDVNLGSSPIAPEECAERNRCNSGLEKPLIAVKPQPHVPLDAVYSRAMPTPLQPAFSSPPYEASPPIASPPVVSSPIISLPYSAVPVGQYSCHLPGVTQVVYHGEQLLMPEPYGRSRVKPLVEKNLHDAALLERELMTYLSKGIQNMDTKAMGHCRWKLQLRYENVILADPRYCAERNVENALWKSSFYQGIETFRRVMEECPEYQEEAKMHLLNLVDEGTIFYENLLDKFQETYGFSLSQFLEPDLCGGTSSPPSAGGVAGAGATSPPGARVLPDSVRLVLISVQKIYICLGDLARYREQAMGTTNYGKARSWYLKAQQIAPKNGRPYNQLAILALYARRKLDAVYYYMRSLAASNPFLTARESLLALFDDARKKYEHLERKHQEEDGGGQPKLDGPWDEERLEIWIRPDGSTSHRSSRQGDQASRELEQLQRLSAIDLNKRYILSFLHVHGKLFTRVGMETFPETARRMLMEFRCLLQRTPAAVTNTRHLQLLAINMFTVANTSLKDRNLDPDCRSLLQEQSLQVVLAHVAILLERATQLLLLQQQQQPSSLPSSSSSSPSSSSSLSSPGAPPPASSSPAYVSDDLAELLPGLKLWTDWMSCQKRLWMPPPSPCDYNTSVKGNVWTTLADFLTALRRLNMSDIMLHKEPAEDRELLTLPEDATLFSFVPLLGAPQEAFYVQVPCDRERARNYLRINRIQFFGDYLCGIATPYLEFNVERKRFVSVIAASDSESDSEREVTYDSSEDELEAGDSLEDPESAPVKSGEEENEIQKLWTKKEQLRKAKEQHERQHACVQAVLQEHRSKQAAVLEIRPRILIPDTNCFIDHLPLVQKLVADGHFFVYVPIVVVNELHGLGRGGSRPGVPSPPDHCEKVGSSARAAMAYLEERFAQREPKLRAITIRGTVMDTISFRSEDSSDYKGTNDDQILTCCLLLCKDRVDHVLPREPDAPVKLYRETVLITEDRNLCVKALTHHVPVRDLPAFLRWANIS